MRLPRTVLVVEDEPLILMAACDIVESAGFTVKDAVNADRALQILEMDSSISVLFTDIDMPGSMDGLSLAVKVHARWPHIGIIVTSGRWLLEPHHVPKGAVFLDKPYLERSLAETLSAVLS